MMGTGEDVDASQDATSPAWPVIHHWPQHDVSHLDRDGDDVHPMKQTAAILGFAIAFLLSVSGCSKPEASEISSAVQADDLDAEMADCFAQAVLEADISGSSLDVLAEDGIATDDGGQVTVIKDDIPTIQAAASECGFELTGSA